MSFWRRLWCKLAHRASYRFAPGPGVWSHWCGRCGRTWTEPR